MKIKLLNSYRTFGPGHCEYGINSQGYRCPELESINWEESILMFGCSHVFGIGLLDDETVTHQLSLALDMPVINLGMGGSGCTYQWVNSTILRICGVSPKAVIYVWPEESRQTIFVSDDILETKSLGFWSIEGKPNYKELGIGFVLDPYHSKSIAKYQRDNLQLIWDCPILHFSLEHEISRENVTQLSKANLDFARDGRHAGPKTNKMWADTISRDLKKIIGPW